MEEKQPKNKWLEKKENHQSLVPWKPHVGATPLIPCLPSSFLTEPDVVRVSTLWILCISEEVAHSPSSKPAAGSPLVIPLHLPVIGL